MVSDGQSLDTRYYIEYVSTNTPVLGDIFEFMMTKIVFPARTCYKTGTLYDLISLATKQKNTLIDITTLKYLVYNKASVASLPNINDYNPNNTTTHKVTIDDTGSNYVGKIRGTIDFEIDTSTVVKRKKSILDMKLEGMFNSNLLNSSVVVDNIIQYVILQIQLTINLLNVGAIDKNQFQSLLTDNIRELLIKVNMGISKYLTDNDAFKTRLKERVDSLKMYQYQDVLSSIDIVLQ